MKAYKVSFTYHLEAEDEAEARQKALGLKATDEPVEIHAMEVALRTERCSSCDRTYVPSEMHRRESEYLCGSCDWDKYPIRDEDIPF
jgi:transposase-like protein